MYRQRIGSRFTQGYQNDVLAANAGVTAKLVRYFEARFDPAHDRATRRRSRRCARRSSPTSTPSPRSTTTASCATSSG